ncbi:hypothetical protein C8Q80DRAFT_1269085 [Daedaleopsis nitida]|nr:hypothetical protein C8Q80DRAFT_1269085 [Daedaleopsis nitida]
MAIDGTLIHTDEFTDVSDFALELDFRMAQKISSSWTDTIGLCGAGFTRPMLGLRSRLLKGSRFCDLERPLSPASNTSMLYHCYITSAG